MLATRQIRHGLPLRARSHKCQKVKTPTTLWELVCLLQDSSVDDGQMLRILSQLSDQGRLRRP
jgi:hypothetical protein